MFHPRGSQVYFLPGCTQTCLVGYVTRLSVEDRPGYLHYAVPLPPPVAPIPAPPPPVAPTGVIRPAPPAPPPPPVEPNVEGPEQEPEGPIPGAPEPDAGPGSRLPPALAPFVLADMPDEGRPGFIWVPEGDLGFAALEDGQT